MAGSDRDEGKQQKEESFHGQRFLQRYVFPGRRARRQAGTSGMVMRFAKVRGFRVFAKRLIFNTLYKLLYVF